MAVRESGVTNIPVTPERQGWFRFTVRLLEDEYRIIGDVLPTAAGEERVTAMELLQTLAAVYERCAEAFHAAALALEDRR